jgi:chromate reductase
MGGEAYITFKPGLVDANDAIAEESTRSFLQAFVDQFASLAVRFASPAKAAA